MTLGPVRVMEDGVVVIPLAVKVNFIYRSYQLVPYLYAY